MNEITYTSYARPVEAGFEFGYIEQGMGSVDISKNVHGATIRRKTHHPHGTVPTFEEALQRMQALPLKSFGGIDSEGEYE